MNDFWYGFCVPIFASVALLGAIVFSCFWAYSGVDTWQWTNIDDKCGVFTTQVKDAWFTPGEDGPLERWTYCTTQTEAK